MWLVEDSLHGSRIREASGELAWSRVCDWVAPWDMAADLATVKLGETPLDPRSLEERLCNEDDFVEALSLTPLHRDAVEEIRCAAEVEDDFKQRVSAALLSDVGSSEKMDLALFERIRAKAASHGIPWRTLPS